MKYPIQEKYVCGALQAFCNKLCLLLTSNIASPSIHCSLPIRRPCSYVHTFPVAEFPFCGISEVQRSKRGSAGKDREGQKFRLYITNSAWRPDSSQQPLCNFKWQYITESGDTSVTFHLHSHHGHQLFFHRSTLSKCTCI